MEILSSLTFLSKFERFCMFINTVWKGRKVANNQHVMTLMLPRAVPFLVRIFFSHFMAVLVKSRHSLNYS